MVGLNFDNLAKVPGSQTQLPNSLVLKNRLNQQNYATLEHPVMPIFHSFLMQLYVSMYEMVKNKICSWSFRFQPISLKFYI